MEGLNMVNCGRRAARRRYTICKIIILKSLLSISARYAPQAIVRRGNEFDNALDNTSHFTRSRITWHISLRTHPSEIICITLDTRVSLCPFPFVLFPITTRLYGIPVDKDFRTERVGETARQDRRRSSEELYLTRRRKRPAMIRISCTSHI